MRTSRWAEVAWRVEGRRLEQSAGLATWALSLLLWSVLT